MLASWFRRKNRWWIIMIWLTALIVYAVWQIDHTLQSGNGIHTVNFGTTPVPVSVTGQPITISMGNNTVWIVDQTNKTILVITRDSSDKFHTSEYNYSSNGSTP